MPNLRFPWGQPYGGPMLRPDGQPAHLLRKGQRCRWYDEQGAQIGPEQPNVAPAVAWALAQGWAEPRECANCGEPATTTGFLDSEPFARDVPLCGECANA